MEKYFDKKKSCFTFADANKEKCSFNIVRGGAVAARWAHNPKVASSSLAPATKKNLTRKCRVFLFTETSKTCFCK